MNQKPWKHKEERPRQRWCVPCGIWRKFDRELPAFNCLDCGDTLYKRKP